MSDKLIRLSDALAVVLLGGSPVGMSNRIAALPAVTVGVKPLVWFEAELPSRGGGKFTSEGYTIRRIEGLWLLDFAGNGKSKWRWVDLDAAKGAAQADYEARILAALEPVAAPVTQDKFSAVDHMSRVADTWMHKAEGLQREIDMLTDPITVHANMLRGTIAKPTVEQIIHLYGVDALTKALAPVIVKEAAPYMTDLMVDPEEIPDMEMEYDHRAGASDDE